VVSKVDESAFEFASVLTVITVKFFGILDEVFDG